MAIRAVAACVYLVLGFAVQLSLHAQAPADPQVAKGIKEVEEGELDAAILTLDGASRRLSGDPRHSRELGQAYLYLGIAYLGKGHEALAKARFRDAVQQVRDLSLSPDQFPPRVLEFLEAAKQDLTKSTPASSPVPANPSPAPKGKGSKLPLILLGGAAVVVGGVAVAAGGGGGSGSGAPSTSANYRLDAADTQPLLAHGGSGGTRFQTPCPTGSLMVGISGRSDIFVTRIAATCAALQADGSLGAETLLGFVGGTNGTAFDDHCPAGQGVVFLGRSEALAPIGVVGIQSLGIGCASVREWVASGTRGQTFPTHGGSGGPAFFDQCSQGYAVTSLTGATGGTIIDALAATCTRILR